MTERQFRLRLGGGEPRVVASIEELVRLVVSALSTKDSVVSLELERTNTPTSGLETRLYKFLGLGFPSDVRRLALYSDGTRVFVSYEQEDHEWVTNVAGPPSDQLVQVRTEAGEPFLVPERQLLPIDRAIALLAEFFDTRKRPESLPWRKHS
jgi:hypothetical protein